jgi:hypothetical protein
MDKSATGAGWTTENSSAVGFGRPRTSNTEVPMKLKTRSMLALATLLIVTGVAIASDPANVRVVHASPDAPAVDILVNDTIRVFADVAFGEATDYASVPANVYNVKVVPAGAPPSSAVIDGDLNLFFNTDYTVVAVDSVSNITPLVLVDSNEPAPFQSSRLRFVHASLDAPAVDIKIIDGPFLFQNVEFKGVGDYVTVPSGIYSLEVRVAGTDTVALEIPGVYFERGTTYTAFATGLVSGSPGLGVLLTNDYRSPSARKGR